MRYLIHEDGSFDILGSSILLHNAYPSLNGQMLRPVRIEVKKDTVTYQLVQGSVSIRFREEPDGRIAICCSAAGLAGIHDLIPLTAATIEGAEKVFVQGFGMEGPSGCFSLTNQPPSSHGLTALYTGDRVLLAYAEDHRHYSSEFRVQEHASLFGEQICLSAGFNLEGTAGDTVVLPAVYVEEGTGLSDSLRHCAERIALSMNARRCSEPAFFWSSWYSAYETMDQALLEETISGIRAESVPFQTIELDAGYSPSLGDWLTPNHRWPEGLEHAAETITGAGFRAGIWVGPFIVGDCSALYRNHPDWVLHDLEGKPVIQLRSYTEPKIWGNPDCNYYVLDTSHPEALAYIRQVFETLHTWGFRFFKTDFLLWNMHDSSTVRRYVPSLTSVEILRNTFSVIRSAIGEESFLLGCIAPFMPMIGYADGMRLAGDCGAQWSVPFGPVNMLQELPYDSYFNNVFWQNDPDAMLLRNFSSSLSDEEVRSLALLQALSGGVVSTSDPVHRMSRERKDLLKMVQPHTFVTPEYPFLASGQRVITLTHRLDQGFLLFVMNPTEEVQAVFYRLSKLFGEENLYQYRMDWSNDEVRSVQEDLFCDSLAPHSSALLFVSRDPLSSKPANLWIW